MAVLVGCLIKASLLYIDSVYASIVVRRLYQEVVLPPAMFAEQFHDGRNKDETDKEGVHDDRDCHAKADDLHE